MGHWHVGYVKASMTRLMYKGSSHYEAIREMGKSFVDDSLIDSFGNVLGIMFNQRYRDVRTSTPNS